MKIKVGFAYAVAFTSCGTGGPENPNFDLEAERFILKRRFVLTLSSSSRSMVFLASSNLLVSSTISWSIVFLSLSTFRSCGRDKDHKLATEHQAKVANQEPEATVGGPLVENYIQIMWEQTFHGFQTKAVRAPCL